MKDSCCNDHTRREFLIGAGVATGWAAFAPSFAFASDTLGGTSIAKLRAFDLADVDLGESPFLHAQRMTEAYLLKLQPDRMLHNFRVNAGLKPKAAVYGGWESESTWEDINCHG